MHICEYFLQDSTYIENIEYIGNTVFFIGLLFLFGSILNNFLCRNGIQMATEISEFEFEALIELGEQLKMDEVNKLMNYLNIPAALCETVSNGMEFLLTVKEWEEHDPYRFYQGLNSIGRADLAVKSTQYYWLSSDHPVELKGDSLPKELSIKTLVNTLKNEISFNDWVQLSLIVNGLKPTMTFEQKMKTLVKEGHITSDLKKLCQLVSVIKRSDIEIELRQHREVLCTIPDMIFISKLEKEVDKLQKEIVKWSESLRKFIETQNRQVKELFDNEDTVDIESIYVPLTVIEGKPREVKLEDETTYSDIELMRKISKKEIAIFPINFKRELRRYNPYNVQVDLDTDTDDSTESSQSDQSDYSDESDGTESQSSQSDQSTNSVGSNQTTQSSQSDESDKYNESVQPELKVKQFAKPQIWLILGNTGSGKSFVCHITALRFGKKELTQFAYCLSVPCRNQEWHQMEQENAGKRIDGDFFAKWMCLSMPIGPAWTSDIAKHILESDGKGLLLIIDSLDEFTKEVPFEQTILFRLLTRKTLSQSTILITSRPGAYTVISSSHLLIIDRFFQVLGFSPINRDRYFSIQLKAEKLKQLKSLIHLHEEMNLLSLIPVNASLFAALIRGTEDITAFTLTQLYSELITYLVRRQLFRMNLKEWSKKTTLFLLPPPVLDCLFRIGEVAYMGVSFRELTSSTDILLKIGKVEKPCYCLGLAEEHIKKDTFGRFIRVWSFCHLTIQEFVGATWLSLCSWGDQCLSTRYIVNSESSFAVFKMSIRFLCGLLSNKANRVMFILFKYQTTNPILIQRISMMHQFRPSETGLSNHLGWREFTEKFLSLFEMLFETDSDLITNSAPYFLQFLPLAPCFYFDLVTPTPNEWECFKKSLDLIRSIHVVSISSSCISPIEFKSLLTHLSCPLIYLYIKLYGVDYSTLSAYSSVIASKLRPGTRISLDLYECDLSHLTRADEPPSSIFQCFSGLSMHESNINPRFFQPFGNQMSFMENLYCDAKDNDFYNNLLSYIYWATQLTVLNLSGISKDHEQQLHSILPNMSNLQEVALHSDRSDGDPYSLLPYLSTLSNLKQLELSGDTKKFQTDYTDHCNDILNNNNQSLRGLVLDNLDNIGLNSLDELLIPLQYCTNLIQIDLYGSELQHVKVNLWYTLTSKLKSLVSLNLRELSLQDSGVAYLSLGLVNHPAIRHFGVTGCKLNSDSCVYITLLIPTLKQLKTLSMRGNELSKQNPSPIENLKQTAILYNVELNL